MVLRPVLWLGLAYIAGEILVWMKFADPAVWIWMACSCLCLTAAAGLIMNKRLYTFFTGRSPDKKTADLAVLIGLPVFFIFGAMRFYTAAQGPQRGLLQTEPPGMPGNLQIPPQLPGKTAQRQRRQPPQNGNPASVLRVSKTRTELAPSSLPSALEMYWAAMAPSSRSSKNRLKPAAR